MLFLKIFTGFILSLSLTSLHAHRVFTTAKVPEDQTDLKFDSNLIPVSAAISEIDSFLARQQQRVIDSNFAPEIILPPGTQQAFVAFPFADKIGIFHSRTGEFLGTITVGKNPGPVTLSPDGKTLGVVSLFIRENLPQGSDFQGQRIGAVSFIDTESLEVRTLNLTQVFFSFANNLIFSADGQTAFVASSNTDEILQINVGGLAEVSPRLKMTAGTRPSSLRMAPDFSFFTAVLVGSTNLDKRAVPDSVAVISSPAFSLLRTIVPETGTPESIIHDFLAFNTVAISSDSKFGLIADVQTSIAGFIPELTPDRGFLIDFEQGKVIKTLNVGGIAGAAYWTPDNRFLVVASLDISFIDPVEQTVQTFSPPRSEFRPYSRPVFSPDGRFLFIGAPLDDRIVVFDMVTHAFPELTVVGGTVKRNEVDVSSAPMALNMTPDGEVLLALNFNANTIDLVRDTVRFRVPRVVSNDELFTGIALTNLDSEKASVIVSGRSVGGVLFTDLSNTEDVVEFVNPRTIEVEAGTQLALTIDEFLQAAPGQTIEGWVDFDSDRADVTGFFLIGDLALKRLDGGLSVRRAGHRILIPEVRVTEGFITELTLLNPHLNSTTVTIRFFNHAGEKIGEVQRSLVANQVVTEFVRDPIPTDSTAVGIFNEATFEEFQSGYLLVESAEGVVAFERYYDTERMAALNGLEISSLTSLPAVQYLPQIAVFQGSDTIVNLINTTGNPIAATLTLKGNDGTDLAAPVMVEIETAKMLRSPVAELFDLPADGPMVSGWVEVVADQPGLAGDAEIQVFSGKGMTTIPLQGRPSQDLIFSHVAQGLGLSTGLALLNPGAEIATVQIAVFRPNGEQVAALNLPLNPGQRDARLLNEFFEGLPGMLGGFIRVTSDRPVVGLQLFFADNLELISAVPAQILP